jgi:uncharacterized membrane protein YtjA (UPF0391 family)
LGTAGEPRRCFSNDLNPSLEFAMLTWALIFLVVALIAGVLGFTSIAGASIAVAKLLFLIFLVLFVVSLIMHLVRGRSVV